LISEEKLYGIPGELEMELDSSVDIASVYMLDGRGSITGSRKEISLYFTVFRATTSYPMDAVVKRPLHEASCSSPSNAEVRNCGTVPPHPHICSWLSGSLSTEVTLPCFCLMHVRNWSRYVYSGVLIASQMGTSP
jgi:hypothetical protein